MLYRPEGATVLATSQPGQVAWELNAVATGRDVDMCLSTGPTFGWGPCYGLQPGGRLDKCQQESGWSLSLGGRYASNEGVAFGTVAAEADAVVVDVAGRRVPATVATAPGTSSFRLWFVADLAEPPGKITSRSRNGEVTATAAPSGPSRSIWRQADDDPIGYALYHVPAGCPG